MQLKAGDIKEKKSRKITLMTVGLQDLFQRLSAMKGTAKLSLRSDVLPLKIKEGWYTLIEMIGSGQFANVYKGIDH